MTSNRSQRWTWIAASYALVAGGAIFAFQRCNTASEAPKPDAPISSANAAPPDVSEGQVDGNAAPDPLPNAHAR